MERTLRICTPAGPLTLSATECGLTAIRFGAAPAPESAASAGDAGLPGGASAGVRELSGGAASDTRDVPGGASSAGSQEHLSDRALSEGRAAEVQQQGVSGEVASDAQDLPGEVPSAEAQDVPDGASTARAAEAVLRQAAEELAEYFAGKRRAFTLPLAPAGTPFQQRVWDELRTIPYGQTRTYREIAAAIGRPRACRAVGMANHRNPLPIVVPCHRVVGASGTLVGYAGGVELKARLLELEAGR